MHAILLGLLLAGLPAAPVGPSKTPPTKLVLAANNGPVMYNHAAHLARQKGDCGFCHNRLWPQSAKAPVRSGAACGSCHLRGGRAFTMKGHCQRCHGAESAAAKIETARSR
jgi:c(7)-type cytochrome triheme protein